MEIIQSHHLLTAAPAWNVAQVAQGHVQPGFGCLQGQQFHRLTQCCALVFHLPVSTPFCSSHLHFPCCSLHPVPCSLPLGTSGSICSLNIAHKVGQDSKCSLTLGLLFSRLKKTCSPSLSPLVLGSSSQRPSAILERWQGCRGIRHLWQQHPVLRSGESNCATTA